MPKDSKTTPPSHTLFQNVWRVYSIRFDSAMSALNVLGKLWEVCIG